VVDLEALGRIYALEWANPQSESDGVPKIFEEILYDSPIEMSSQAIHEVYRAGVNIPGLDGAPAARAIESWIALYRDAPLLAWPMLICLLLRHLEPSALVVFDLSDDAQASEADNLEAAHAYVDNYWLDASASLSGFADTLGRLFSVLASFDSRLGRQFWFARAADLLGQLKRANASGTSLPTKARGDALESLVEAIMRIEEPELQIIEKNFRTQEEEIDLLLANGMSDPFWTGMGSPLIMVECKNWKEPNKPGVAELRVLESKMADRRSICKIGIFISVSGFSDTFMTRLKAIQSDGGMIFAVTGDNLSKLVEEKIRLTDWLKVDGLRQSLRGSKVGR
jgi:Holliday junction resolvase-like predicted endonuclease